MNITYLPMVYCKEPKSLSTEVGLITYETATRLKYYVASKCCILIALSKYFTGMERRLYLTKKQ